MVVYFGRCRDTQWRILGFEVVAHAASEAAASRRIRIRNKSVFGVCLRGSNEGVGAGFLGGGQRTSSRTASGGGPAAATCLSSQGEFVAAARSRRGS
mgnify:CR=1 FL=1